MPRLCIPNPAGTVSDPDHPAEVVRFALRGSLEMAHLTSVNAGLLAGKKLAKTEELTYTSTGNAKVQGWMVKPPDFDPAKKYPLILEIHGGPFSMYNVGFNYMWQNFAANDFVVLYVNPRGSTGYGLDFQKANFQDLGGGDLKDEIAAVDFLKATGYVDPKKIGITGGSYGGYMAMIAIGRTPDVWAASVELFGITDWLTEQEHEDPPLQQYDQSILGDPVKDRQSYEDASPIKYFKDAKAPLLILQGANDIRDPKEEAEQAETILKKEGKIVAAHYYPDEGHGFEKRENQIDASQRTVEHRSGGWVEFYQPVGRAPAEYHRQTLALVACRGHDPHVATVVTKGESDARIAESKTRQPRRDSIELGLRRP